MRQRVSRAWRRGETGGRPRLLVEDPLPELAISDFHAYKDAGFAVAWCSGPGPGEPCPLVSGRRCDLIDAADIVVCDLDIADDTQRSAREAVLASDAGPAVIEMPLLLSVSGRVRLLWRALARRRQQVS